MKLVAILSGGMDSTTLVYDLVSQGHEVHCLSFDYGQKHVRELQAAATTTRKMNLPHHIVDFHSSMKALFATSALTSDTPVPEGHYADENMKQTVVPNRNMVMLSIAAAHAIGIGADGVAYGAHGGDHSIYPDCRPEFYDAVARCFLLCDFKPLQMIAPYMTIDKGGIAAIGKQLGVPYEDTWTCYKGEERPCGVCGSCVERAEAFAFAGMEDPTCLF